MTQMEYSGSPVGYLSNLMGATEPALRLLLTLFAAYPIALLHRKFFYGKNPNIQHIFFVTTSLILGYWNYGLSIFHLVAAIFVTYAVLSFWGGKSCGVAATFLFNMGYLLTAYFCVGTDSYDINWTVPHCVLVLRLIGIAFDLYDGQQPPEGLALDNKKVALTQCPSLLEFSGHMLFPASFMIGPQFPMKRYQDFVNGCFSGGSNAPGSIDYALKRLGLGILYLTIFQILGIFVWDTYFLTAEFKQLNFIYRMLLLGVWGRYTLYKYISCWLLAEGACAMFGLSHNGVGKDAQLQWDGLANVKLAIFENTTEFNHYIQSFNTNTNHWLAQYIYKRLKFLGNRQISQAMSLLFLAIWHGFHSGYYVCFMFEFIVIYVERDVKDLVKSNENLSHFFGSRYVKMALSVILRIYTFIFMGWCLLPFVLLKFNRYWNAFSSVSYCGIVLYVMWPLVYAPILRLIFIKKPCGKLCCTCGKSCQKK